MNELLWSDPHEGIGRVTSKRGTAAMMFDKAAAEAFCKYNNLDYIIRSHEVEQEGYRITHGGKTITVFSAPKYW